MKKEEKDIELEEQKETKEQQETPETEAENKAEATEETAGEEETKDAQEAAKEPSLEEQIEELKKQALYKQAKFENFRKLTLKKKADLILTGGEKTITAILPILDDFERAIADQSDDPAAIKEGMMLIF